MGVYKRGKNWCIDFYAHGNRVRQKIGPNKKLAENILSKLKTAVVENKYLDIRKKRKVKFEILKEQYMDYAKANKRSWERDERSLKTLSTWFGGKYLYEITAHEIENYKKERLKSVAPASVNRELACLKHMLNKALEWEVLDVNPAKKVKLFRERNQRNRYLNEEEIEKLYDASPDHLKPIIVTALLTGMRRNEILSLKWEDIDFNQGLIFIKNSKNDEMRKIPINNHLISTLKSQRFVSPYVFPKGDGSRRSSIRTAFLNAVKRANIKDFRFHDLRHTFGSHLAMSGVDLITIKELMGHKTMEMTLRYAHLSPDHKRHAVNCLKFFDSHNLVTRACDQTEVERISC